MPSNPGELSHPMRRMLPHMPHVTAHRATLQSLESVWDVLNLLGQLSGTTTDMAGTKAAFASLTASLLHNLALTTYNKRVQEIAAQARVAIDILVRNLYERTADIGFLAMDDAVRDFAAAALRGDAPESAPMVARLQAYVRLYSVYRDVILVAPSGQVLTRLPGGPQVDAVRDPLLAEVLASAAPYVEAAARSDLFPGESRNLLYGTRVLAQDGAVLGALFLCFDFTNETARIFASLGRAGDWSVMTLLDQDGRVIASSDPDHVAPGALMTAPYGDGHITRFAGAAYLTARHAAQAFQGYTGPPGWSALVLVPLAMAFGQDDDDDGADASSPAADAALMRAILRSGTLFPPALQAIPAQADAIQRELNRSVWNANIRQGSASQGADGAARNPAFSRVLLGEIVRTGMRMKEVFTQSIDDLQGMTVTSQLDDCRFHAALAMDILDRNLYERANDCRWWALDPLLRGLLEHAGASERAALLTGRLAAINDLYSVYDSLLLFDADGVVVAVSRPAVQDLIGSALDDAWCKAALAAPHDSYVVSEFATAAVYRGRPTFIYSAPMCNDRDEVIGGIAAVFDSAPQLAAVLAAGLPQSKDAFALFIDDADNVIASTDPGRTGIGKAGLPAPLRAAVPGGIAQLSALHGQVLAVGARGSTGYREYGGTEGRAGQRLLAVVCVPLSTEAGIDAEIDNDDAVPAPAPAAGPAPAGATIDIASFYVGRSLLGVPAASVVEAMPFGGIVRLPNAPEHVCGAIIYHGATLLLYDLHKALAMPARAGREHMLIIVLRGPGGRQFGVLAERLGDIPTVAVADIAPITTVFAGMTPLLASVVMTHAAERGPMLTLLAVDTMAAMLNAR